MQKVMTGTGRTVQNGKAGAAFLSFEPLPLQEYRFETESSNLIDDPDHPAVDLGGCIEKELEQTNADLALYKKKYEELNAEQQEKLTERVLREDADASMHLAMKPRSITAGFIDLNAMMKMNDFDAQEEEDFSFLKRAYRYAFQRNEEIPISKRLISEVHDLTMHAGHNEGNKPGVFRRTVTWIGPAGSTPADAVYVPPVPETMNEGWNALEHYIHEENAVDPLVKSALIHYQFEILHPFLDGNGRTGRILSLLHLHEEGYPVFPLTKMILRYKDLYYRRLMKAELNGDIEGWISFWVHMIHDSVKDAMNEKI
jgi:Fic family protein